MTSATTTEFVIGASHADAAPFSLIEQNGLISRLFQELRAASTELTRDPFSFLWSLFSANAKDAKRSQRIRIGLACALALHVALLLVIAAFGWRTVFVKTIEERRPGLDVTLLKVPSSIEKMESKPEVPAGEGGGGGGGGQHTAIPPSEGVPPQMRPLPQVVKLNTPSIPEPSLSIMPTVVGPESPPPPPAPIGDPTGKGAQSSGGPGSEGGIGRGRGTGVGDGTESGAGRGGRGGKGGATAGSLEGSNIPGVIDFNRFTSFPSYKPFSWMRRPTPIITPEAQENKVIGIVLLRATFNADGTITEIEVVMPVEFMTESAIEALRRSTFRPATINGAPVTVRKVPVKVFVHY